MSNTWVRLSSDANGIALGHAARSLVFNSAAARRSWCEFDLEPTQSLDLQRRVHVVLVVDFIGQPSIVNRIFTLATRGVDFY